MNPEDALALAVSTAGDVAEYDDVGEYGYGGEVHSCDRVVNWHEVIDKAIARYLAALNAPDGAPEPEGQPTTDGSPESPELQPPWLQ